MTVQEKFHKWTEDKMFFTAQAAYFAAYQQAREETIYDCANAIGNLPHNHVSAILALLETK